MTYRVCAAALAGACLALPAVAQDDKKNDAAVAAIRQTGAHVLPIAQDDDRLDVAYHLSDAKLTPAILGKLAEVKGRLYSLNLRGTNLNDELAQHLAPLTELGRLHLENTAITDAGLAHLAGMQKLEYLNLYRANITDAGVEHLKKLKGLKKVYVWQTKITLEGVHTLEKALPEVQVIGGPPEPEEPKEPVAAPRPGKPEAPAKEKEEDQEKKDSTKDKK